MKTVFWPEHTDYLDACRQMQQCVHLIKKGHAAEQIWYLEHESVYTSGPRGHVDSVGVLPFPFVISQRGGDMTFHGPGQRVVYVMIDLRRRGWDVHHYIDLLEWWFIQSLGALSIRAWGGQKGRGLWTEKGKIASIGIKVTAGITWHGIACNILDQSGPFQAIAPCGTKDQKMASVSCFLPEITMQTVDQILMKKCPF